jgi:hypothetical protein
MTLDRRFLVCGLAYAICGMCVGIYMAASKDHSEFIAHAHILLVGFVVSFLYGLIHKLWISAEVSRAAKVQFYIHQVATFVLSLGLLLFFKGLYQEQLDPVLAVASLGVLTGALMMVYLVVRFPKRTSLA